MRQCAGKVKGNASAGTGTNSEDMQQLYQLSCNSLANPADGQNVQSLNANGQTSPHRLELSLVSSFLKLATMYIP